jgi:predicted nucleic acid-binding protein
MKFTASDSPWLAAGKGPQLLGVRATVIKPSVRISLLKDDPDNSIFECAKDSGTDLIVTGNKHLLALKDFEGIGITKIAGLLSIFEPAE